MNFSMKQLCGYFEQYEFTMSFFSINNGILQIGSFTLEDIIFPFNADCVRQQDSDIPDVKAENTFFGTIGVVDTEHSSRFFSEWEQAVKNRDSAGQDDFYSLRDIVIIGNSNTDSPSVIRIGRFFNTMLIPGSTVSENGILKVCFSCDRGVDDFSYYLDTQ